MSDKFAHDTLAFLLVECNLPYELAINLTVDDPLYTALIRTYNRREDRLNGRTALQCMVINNTHGGKSKITDFMPRKQLSVEEREAQIAINVEVYNNNIASRNITG